MAGIRAVVERELKLGAPRQFRLPELPGEPLPERVFTSTYYDTAEHRLAREGVTLRRRVEGHKGLWQLKLPRGIARIELELAGGPGAPPPEIRDLITAFARREELAPVAKLRTRRSGIRVIDTEAPTADVTLDVVSVIRCGHVIGGFREIEAELVDGDEKALRRIEKALRVAGAAASDNRPKLLQALDLPAPEPLERPGADAAFADHFGYMLAAQYRAILVHDPGTRLGEDPEELHQMRVSTRRLRAFLRAARPLLDRDWATSLRAELGWLGAALGPVRDLDVLIEHLREDAASLEPKEQRALGRLFSMLDAERTEARGLLLQALRSDRYVEVLDRLEAAVAEPRIMAGNASVTDLAAAEFRRLRKAVRALDPDPPDDDLHDLRIRGKRARYAAELAEPAAGRAATRFIAEAKAFQDVLGEHQDAVVAEERIRAAASKLGSAPLAFAAGRLVERERERKRLAREAFPAAWKRLERRGKAAWT